MDQLKDTAMENVLKVYHLTKTLLSLKTTRNSGLRFKSGQFLMIGIENGIENTLRAYSIASPHYEKYLEFFSIKVGQFTENLQHLKVGERIVIMNNPTGTILMDDMIPGKYLYLIATGTGLAPFISLIKDPDVYEAFEKVIILHGVRSRSELASRNLLKKELSNILYYPTVTMERFETNGRITKILSTGKLFEEIKMHNFNPNSDRVMICGRKEMLKESLYLITFLGLNSVDYVRERAFR